jgi:hypothetical protein
MEAVAVARTPILSVGKIEAALLVLDALIIARINDK